MDRGSGIGVVVLALVLAILLGWNLYRAQVEPRLDEAPAVTTPLPGQRAGTEPGRVVPFAPTGRTAPRPSAP